MKITWTGQAITPANRCRVPVDESLFDQLTADGFHCPSKAVPQFSKEIVL